MNIDKALQTAVEYSRSGNFHQAEQVCNKILETQPDNADALHFLGIIQYQRGNYDSAIEYMEKALHLDPNVADAYYNLGNVFHDKGHLDDAIACYQKALKIDSNFADAYNNLGNALHDKGHFDDAIACYQKALKFDPNFADAYNNLGNALHNKGHFDDAIACYQKALKINPNFADAYNNLGNALHDKGHINGAITLYQKALELNPSCIDAYMSLGNILREKGYLDDAITCYQKALHVKPEFAEAYNNIGVAFMDEDNIDEAVRCFQKSLQLKPDSAETYSNLVYLLQQTCDWQKLDGVTVRLDGLTSKSLDTGIKPAESPFLSITRHTNPSLNFTVAKSWSLDIARAMSNVKMHFPFDDRTTGKTNIVIGYLSNEFRNHATAHLMLSLFGLHNRDEFKIFCYSYGKDDRSSYRVRIQNDCDKFVDLTSFNYTDAAKHIYEDQVDILVDLKGYSRGNRLAICALRPAPIQVSYLGFPGTTGADFIDYIITDKIVTPEEHAPYYSEKFVYLPHCYQVNDHTQPISNKAWRKKDFGLPENSFVFCSFNHPYKIDLVMFDVWMRILRQVPESVLWLLFKNKISENNLRREAEARGVQPERLIFGENLPKDEHLSRLRLADLSLDTRIVNGHATTSDALWAGVPVITLQGSHFASRVSSSLLSAIGLPKLIIHSLEEYEALAVGLAHNPVELQVIQQKLDKNRLVDPLFDTPRFVRNLESAYKEMWKIFSAGEAPRQIKVLES